MNLTLSNPPMLPIDPEIADFPASHEACRATDPREDARNGSMFTFEIVQERLIEAIEMIWRLPDREAGWLNASIMPLWRQVIRERGVDYVHSDERPRRPGLTRHEVDRMDQALSWMDAVPDDDRKLVGLAIVCLARGMKQVPWMELRKPMGIKLGAHGLRKRYGRAISGICSRLNWQISADLYGQ